MKPQDRKYVFQLSILILAILVFSLFCKDPFAKFIGIFWVAVSSLMLIVTLLHTYFLRKKDEKLKQK